MINTIILTIGIFAFFVCIFLIISLTIFSPKRRAKIVLTEKKQVWLWKFSCCQKTFVIFLIFFFLLLIFTIAASSVPNYEDSAVVKILFSGLALNLLATAIYEVVKTASESYRKCLFDSLSKTILKDESEQRKILDESKNTILYGDNEVCEKAVISIINVSRNEIMMTGS